MTEREMDGLREVFESILVRHDGEDKKAVAAMLVDLIVTAYDDTEGRIIQ